VREAGLAKLGHVGLDGTKMKANASKHKAMSYGRMEDRAAELEAEVAKCQRWRGAARSAGASLGDVRGAQGTGQTFACEPDLFRGIADFLALARHYEVDGAADLGGDALGRQQLGRRWGIERRKGAFSWRVFHDRHHLRMTGGGNAPQTSRFWRLTKSLVSQFDSGPTGASVC
jgi:hypothetical protein